MESSSKASGEKLRKRRPWRKVALGFLTALVVLAALASLTGDWYVWVIRATDGGPGILFFEATYVTEIPADAPAFGAGLGIAWATGYHFSLGWRTRLASARKMRRDDLPGDIVEIVTDWGGREFYAVSGGAFGLIRLESSDGQAGRNVYHAPNLRVGPDVQGRSEEDWENELLAKDPGRNLQALVWLGGIHLDPSKEPQPMFHHEDLREAKLAAAVRERPAVKNRLEELATSSSPWLRQAADLARRPVVGVPW